METQALVATRSCLLLPRSLVQCQVQDGRSVPIPSSLGKQWSFRVERRRVTLLSSRRRYLVDVRAKKSGAGSIKLKSKEPEAEEEDDQPAPETKKFFKLPGTVKVPSKGGNRKKDKNTVFVAGATGKVGRRTVRELVRLGYKVRACVRNVDSAQFLLEQEEEREESKDEEVDEQSQKGLWANFSPEKLFGFLGPKAKQAAQLVELVQCDLEKDDDIEEALGNAGVVICTIGASEKEVLDVTGPYRVDYKATKNLIDAASSAQVNHFILVTSLGTQKFGWPASVLNLFWGVLYWKAKAEKALIESGIPFTIVRPGGMEKPTDAYKETHNLRLAEADTLFGGQVSNLQVAELMASIVGNLDLARNKILEAVAETTAPLLPIADLLAEISTVDAIKPVKRSDEVKETKQTKQAPKQRQEEEKASQRAKAAKEAAEEKERAAALKRQAAEQQKTEAVRQKLQNEYESARLKEEEARQEAEAARAQKEEVERKAADLRSKLKAAAQAAREAKALETALIAAARQGKKLSDREKQDIISSIRAEIEAEEKAAEAKEKALQAPKEKPKLEVKAKEVRAPVKSKADVAAEKQAKQAAEAKAAAETELSAKAEAEAKAKADAEEAEKKRIEAEQRAKKEEEKKMKLEAERKAKEEEEKIRIEAERKGKEEEEEKMRIEAERKSQEEAEKQAAAKAEAETETAASFEKTDANPKGFRWPWQGEEPEEEIVPTTSSTTEEAAAPEETQTSELPRPSRPLSPYTQFPTLKPPGPPTPPPAPKVQEAVTEAATEVLEEPVIEKEEEKTPAVVDESSPEKTEKAASGGFRWPWQKPEPEEEPSQEETAGVELDLSPTINQTTKQEVAATDKTELPRPSRPLSPYTAYPALKPPPPPIPPKTNKPGGEKIEAKAEAPQVTPEPSAPVVEIQAQEESQDEINARAEQEEQLRVLAAKEAEAVAERERLAVERANASAGFRWPWENLETASEEAQPEVTDVPSSADSTVPGEAEVVPEVASSAATETSESASTTELPKKSRPLSPYTMYPGLKPPPTPSPPKSPTKEPAEAALSEKSQSAYEGSENGSAAEAVEEDGEKVLEPAGAFRWPWQQ